MQSITDRLDMEAIGQLISRFFTEDVDTLARETKLVQRRSRLTGALLLKVLVFGFLSHSRATLKQLAQLCAESGVWVKPQALDGRIKAVAVQDAPATLNQAGRPDGQGPATELWGALRVTDLPEIAALLWPTDLVFVGWRPESYRFAEETYRRLGAPGAVRHVKHLSDYA